MKLHLGVGFLLCALAIGSLALAAPQSSTSAAVGDGRAIFQTGRDVDGKHIVAVPPAMFPSCAACHGANGAGGKHLPGGAVSADLRHAALVTHQSHPYTLALLERAISTGVDNDGKKLDPVMPHWRLSARDLHDVATYVYTQLK